MKKLCLLWTILLILLTACQKSPLPASEDFGYEDDFYFYEAEENYVYGEYAQTFVLYEEKEHHLLPKDSMVLTNLLRSLDYDPEKVCKCADYTLVATTDFGIYYVSMDEAYARTQTEEGILAQANLSESQMETIRTLLQKLN